MCLVLVSEVLVLEKELGIHDMINPASQDSYVISFFFVANFIFEIYYCS